MKAHDAVIAVFKKQQDAEEAVRRLADAGFTLKDLSVVGGGHGADEVFSFHRIGETIKFWGSRGAFWGALWSLFFGGLFIAFPGAGVVIVLGYLATTVISGIESDNLAGGFGALGEALSGIGVPVDSAARYEDAIAAGSFLVMAHVFAEDAVRARQILDSIGPSSLLVHPALTATRRV